MKRFAESVIKPYLLSTGYETICEVGAQFGENTDQLLELGSVHVTVIDPCLDADLRARHAEDDRITMHQGLSLEVLPELDEPFDCILLDGDHNWYTVYHELRMIAARGLCRSGGTILLHDVSWPYGRRDMYFQPETIPDEFRQPFARGGIVKGLSALTESGGVNDHLYNALREGGPRNGVMTAIEDFLGEHPYEYDSYYMNVQFGLMFLFRKTGAGEDDAFHLYRKQMQRRLAVGKVKDFMEAHSPRLYAALKKLRETARGH